MGHASSNCCANDEKAPVENIVAGQFTGPSVAVEQIRAISHELGDFVDNCEGTVDLTRTASSQSLLRGITLSRTLQGGGRLWRRKPPSLNDDELAFNFSLSDPVKRLDVFFSHTWLTPGRWKFLSLLLRYGWPIMLTTWATGTALSCLLTLLGVFPMIYQAEIIALNFHKDVPVGWAATVSGFLSSTVGLLLFPYLCRRDRKCFLDCTCIDQIDKEKMQEGIRNIGGFLESAAELHVLWSGPFLSRQGCCLLLCFGILGPSKRLPFKVTIACQSLPLETILLQWVLDSLLCRSGGPPVQ